MIWREEPQKRNNNEDEKKGQRKLLTMNLIWRAILWLVGSVHFSKYIGFSSFSARILSIFDYNFWNKAIDFFWDSGCSFVRSFFKYSDFGMYRVLWLN